MNNEKKFVGSVDVSESNNPLISIIIPVFNGETFIEKTINNILKSTYKNIEVIIVDDGSVDRSGIICKQIQSSDSRVKYYYKDNGGIAQARNYGIERALGEYICFSDQDDFLKNDMYECLLNDMLVNNCDIVSSNYAVYYENGSPETHFVNNIIDSSCVVTDTTLLIKYLLFHQAFFAPKYKIPEMIWCCLFKRDIIINNNLKFFSILSNEDDWLFMLQYLKCSKNAYLDNRYFYLWQIRSLSTSHKKVYRYDYYNKRKILRDYLKQNYLSSYFTEEEIAKFLAYYSASTIVKNFINNLLIIDSFSNYRKVCRNNKEVYNKEKIYLKLTNPDHEYKKNYGKRNFLYLKLFRLHMEWIISLLVLIRRKFSETAK